MDSRQDKINTLLQEKIALIINANFDFPEVFLTVLRVSADNNVSELIVEISVLPQKLTGSVLKDLRRQSAFFAKEIQKKAKLKRVPKISWRVEDRNKDVSSLENLLNSL
ncbi:MAG: ribosome-binding factor A [Candidatus Pacebacteria bacterium]|nr:ribosome-binding factor A [Candidatus Paceibacterota bacterium]